MTVEPSQVRYTPAEYRAFERAAETKHEYLGGVIRAMTGASRRHNLVTGNLTRLIGQQLLDSTRETYVNDMRVRVNRTGLYTYPNIAVARPPIEFEDDEVDTLLNPIFVIEVLARSTASYDRGLKFANYRRLDSLREYVLVSQDSPHIERYLRQGDTWIFSEVTGLDSVVPFEAIGCSVSLRDVYHRVNLDTDSLASPFDAGSPQTD